MFDLGPSAEKEVLTLRFAHRLVIVAQMKLNRALSLFSVPQCLRVLRLC